MVRSLERAMTGRRGTAVRIVYEGLLVDAISPCWQRLRHRSKIYQHLLGEDLRPIAPSKNSFR